MEPTRVDPAVQEELNTDSEVTASSPGKEIAVMFPSPNWFHSRVLAVSTDGWVVYGALTRGLCILQPVGNNYRIHIVNYAHGDRISCVAISDDWETDRRLLSGSIDGVVKQWKVQEEDDDVKILPLNAHNVHKLEKEEVISVSYCGDAAAVTVGSSGVLVKWDLTSNVTRIHKKLFRHFRPTSVERCPHDPLMIAVGTKQGVLFVIDFHTRANIVIKIRGHDDDITGIAWCPQAEVELQIAAKYTAAIRMKKIRNEKTHHKSESPLSVIDNVSSRMNKSVNETEDETKDNPDKTKDNESVVEEDDMFDIYADHEHVEFGHRKYEPEEIRVPAKKEAENVDFLAECLKLKNDILENKSKLDTPIHSLVKSLENASIGKGTEDVKDGEKENVTLDDFKSDVQESEVSPVESVSGTSNEPGHPLMQTYSNLLCSIDKNGKACLWSKSGKLLAHSQVGARSKHVKGTTKPGAIHWYRGNILLATDNKSSVFECNPLVIDSANKIEFKPLHSAHKRGLYCITSAAANVHGNSEIDHNIWSVGQDRNLVLYSHSKGAISQVYGTFGGYVYHINPCPYDSQRLALSSGDGNVRVVTLGEDVEHAYGPVTCYWQNVQGRVTVTAWHATKEGLLAFGTAEGRVGLIDTGGNKEKHARLLGSPLRRGVYSLSWRGNSLYVCAMGELIIYDISKSNCEPRTVSVQLEGKCWSLTESCWSERGLCVGSKDGEVAVLTDSEPHLVLAAAFSLQKMVQCIAWHPQSVTLSEESSIHKNWIAVTAQHNTFVILELCEEEGSFKLKELAKVCGHRLAVVRVVWSPHHNGVILSTSLDATVRVWNISVSGEVTCTSVFARHQFNTLTAAWWPRSARAHWLLSGGGDHSLRLWDTRAFPPTSRDDENTKTMHFAMAMPESAGSDGKKDKHKGKKAELHADNDNGYNETDPSTSKDQKDDEQMAVDYQNIKKKIDKKSLFPVSHKQTLVNGLKGCRVLLKKYVKEHGGADNGEDDTEEKGLEFIKLFGTQDEFNEILDLEQEDQLARDRMDLWSTLGVMRGRVELVFRTAAERDLLSPFLLCLAPMVSHRFWKDQMQAFISQLERKSTDKPQNQGVEFEECSALSTSGVHRKLMLLLSQHDVAGAVGLLTDLEMFREAYVLARVRYMEQLAAEMLGKWADYQYRVGNRVQAALCNIARGNLVEAATQLSKQSGQEALDVAAEIAKVSGQESFADSLTRKRDRMSQQCEEALKTLPERLALHLKMVQEGKGLQNGASEGKELPNGGLEGKESQEGKLEVKETQNGGSEGKELQNDVLEVKESQNGGLEGKESQNGGLEGKEQQDKDFKGKEEQEESLEGKQTQNGSLEGKETQKGSLE